MKMKMLILTSITLISFPALSQVGIETNTPESTLDVRAANHLGTVSSTDGILVPRVNSLSVNGSKESQLVYLTVDAGSFSKGFHYWNGTAWAPINTNIEPWYGVDDNAAATSNTENIYSQGNVTIGATTTSNTQLTVVNNSLTTKSTLKASLPSLDDQSNISGTSSALYEVVIDNAGNFFKKRVVPTYSTTGGIIDGEVQFTTTDVQVYDFSNVFPIVATLDFTTNLCFSYSNQAMLIGTLHIMGDQIYAPVVSINHGSITKSGEGTSTLTIGSSSGGNVILTLSNKKLYVRKSSGSTPCYFTFDGIIKR